MVVLDIETSGLVASDHGLLAIGAVDILRPADVFYSECRIRKGEKIDPEALLINGFTVAEARDSQKMSTKALLAAFKSWLDARQVKVIGGLHIAAFDVPFLNTKAEQTDSAFRLHRRSIDLHTLAYARMLQQKKVVPLTDGWSVMDTDVINPFCGLPMEQSPHNALQGAKLEAECLVRLIYGKGLFQSFRRYAVPDYLKTSR